MQSHRSPTTLLVTIMQLEIIISTPRSTVAQTISSEPLNSFYRPRCIEACVVTRNSVWTNSGTQNHETQTFPE